MRALLRDERRPAAGVPRQGAATRRSARQALGLGATLDGDSGSRERALVSLSASAGNGAVAAALSTIQAAAHVHAGLAVVNKVASTEAPTRDGAQRIADARGGGSRAAGYTSLPAPGAPDLVVTGPSQVANGTWSAAVQATSVTPDAPSSLYPGPGVHDIGPGPTGQQRHKDVTGPMSNLIKRGEEEHLLDLEWARHLSYDTVADAINAVAAAAPATGDSAEAARNAATNAVRGRLPAQLRWADGQDPGLVWRRAYSHLAHVTIERDTPNGWHNMTSGFVLDPAEKRRLGVPEADELTRYVGGTEIGQHPSEHEVRARFDELGGQRTEH
jgi:hypothetical protein